MGVVNLSEIGLHLKQHSVAILSRNRTLTALPGTRTPNMLYDCHNDVANKPVNCRSFPMTRLRDCRLNASSTSRRSNLSLKSLILVELMGKLNVVGFDCFGWQQIGG
ncbi:hypothetical protein T02_4578 [Trichinella nativa]|uniref:Uncharacterized protein n=1 Tax=Trichinella nativa TaxID=6335 RepID=A0A0V1L997_9BILA|nr:hypothetical protein T02_4578 [Trichinella nativa]